MKPQKIILALYETILDGNYALARKLIVLYRIAMLAGEERPSNESLFEQMVRNLLHRI